MWFWSHKNKPTPEFIEWCKSVPPKAHPYIGQKIHEGLGILQNHSASVQLQFDNTFAADVFEIDGKGASYKCFITSLTLSNTSLKGLSIHNTAIWTLNFPHHNADTLTLRNVAISKLYLQGGKIVLENCNVGSLILVNGRGLELLDVRGGCILEIECPLPWQDSPFIGSVSFADDVFLPRNPDDYFISSAQPYRNVRSHLRKLENSQGANLFHSAELAMERKTDTRFNKYISFLYEYFSDFGSSTLRPLAWLFGLWLISFIFIFISNGAVPIDGINYSGWRHILLDSDYYGRFLRALVLSLQQISSPLTILGTNSLLVAKSVWLANWSVFQSLLSVILIALFILAVRRRFKMQ